jgi:hypothetical protein
MARPPTDLVRQLLLLAPEAVKVQNKYGDLPFHSATMKRASFHVANLLLQEYDNPLKEHDRNGN